MLVARNTLSLTAVAVKSQLKKYFDNSLYFVKIIIATVLAKKPTVPNISEPYPTKMNYEVKIPNILKQAYSIPYD